MKTVVKGLMMLLIVALAAGGIGFGAKGTDRPEDRPDVSAFDAMGKAADLMAGKTMDVGDIFISPAGGNEFLVTYQITEEGYYLKEIHFEGISKGELQYISTKGTLVPGRFTVNADFPVTADQQKYSFKYIGGAPLESFAAHAVVGWSEDMAVVSDPATLYQDVALAWQPSVAAYVPGIPGDPWTTLPGAAWIWNSYLVAGPTMNETVLFQRSFSVPGAIQSGQLSIAADNDFDADLNGMAIGAGTPGGNNYGSAAAFDVAGVLQQGPNMLDIAVTNWAADVGPMDNPAGLLYRLDVLYEAGMESAWGAGQDPDPDTSNWSMVIPMSAIED